MDFERDVVRVESARGQGNERSERVGMDERVKDLDPRFLEMLRQVHSHTSQCHGWNGSVSPCVAAHVVLCGGFDTVVRYSRRIRPATINVPAISTVPPVYQPRATAPHTTARFPT